TRGDQMLDSPLAKVGRPGLFIKEQEVAMLEGRADIAAHSMKDVPTELPPPLELELVGEREDYRDAFVSNTVAAFDELPEGAVVRSSSLRPQCQLRAQRPDIVIKDLRGNVNTRLKKLDAGDYDAIVLAAAGLKRLGMTERIREYLDTELCLPAGGQGAIGIECRENDDGIQELIAGLQHDATAKVVRAERAMNMRLNGGCQVPIACLAEIDTDNMMLLRGLVGDVQGKRILRSEVRGSAVNPEILGVTVADELLAQGASEILDALLSDQDSA